MAVLQLNGQNLQLNSGDLYLNGIEGDTFIIASPHTDTETFRTNVIALTRGWFIKLAILIAIII